MIDDEMRDDPNWGKIYQPEDEPVPRVFKGIAVALIMGAIGMTLGWLLGLAWNWG